MVAAGILVFTCALTAGYVTRRISQHKPVIHSLVIVLFITIETVWIISGQRSDAPVWFDILGGMNLIAGILIGASFPEWTKKLAR